MTAQMRQAIRHLADEIAEQAERERRGLPGGNGVPPRLASYDQLMLRWEKLTEAVDESANPYCVRQHLIDLATMSLHLAVLLPEPTVRSHSEWRQHEVG